MKLLRCWLYECPDCGGQRVNLLAETDLGHQMTACLRWCACPAAKIVSMHPYFGYGTVEDDDDGSH